MNYQTTLNNAQIFTDDLYKKFDEYSKYPEEEKIAVFDFDNTLIHGDIGEAIFAGMIKNNKELNYSWKEYNMNIAEGNTVLAYKKLIGTYENLNREIILSYTENFFDFESSELEYFSFIESGKFHSVPKPMLNRIMFDIILKLKSIGFSIYIISASSDISVKCLGNKLFDIPKENIFGMKNETNEDGILTANIIEPAPCFEGKAELYNQFISDKKPLITAGDSENDVAFMNLTSAKGMKLILKKAEDDEDDFDAKLKVFNKKLTDTHNNYIIKPII
jgi:HAD superfamily phosphoserine phosphatase-like hydrolase